MDVILAVDPGLANCGWALVRPRSARVVALGVVVQETDSAIDRSTDRARRALRLSRVLGDLVEEHDVDMIASESMSFPRGVSGIASLSLAWGVLAGIAAYVGIDLVEVTPKAWQHAVMPDCVGAIDYHALEKKLAEFAGRSVAEELLAIKPGKRTHALDAMGVGLYAALIDRPQSIAVVA